MKNTLFDTESVTKTALFGGVEGWYDTFWLGEQPGAGRRCINKVAALPWETIAATCALYSVLRIRMRKVFALSSAAVVPFDFQTESQRLQTRTK